MSWLRGAALRWGAAKPALVSLNQARPLLSRLLHLSRNLQTPGLPPALVSVVHKASLQKEACFSVHTLLALVML